MALGVTQTNANTMVGRLRETIERSLGALLVARRVQNDPGSCPELATVLHGWDGKFNILMRKRIARHIESCEACEDLRRRCVNPAALLGAPVFVPAPAWLKKNVMQDFELTSASHRMSNGGATSSPFHAAATAARPAIQPPRAPYRPAPEPVVATTDVPVDEDKRRVVPFMALLIGLPLVILGATLAWVYLPSTALSPSGVVQPAPVPTPAPSVPAPTPAAVLPTPQPPKATAGPQPVQKPRPAAPLPTPQAKLPVPTAQAPLPTAIPPQQPPPAVQAPAPLPEPIPQPPLGSIPFPGIPFPQNPLQVPPLQPRAQAPAQVPQQAPPAQAPAQLPPAQQPPAQAPAQVPDPVGPAPQQVPDPVGPAPKKVDPAAPKPCDPTTDVCVK
jgi:hypothetical protein